MIVAGPSLAAPSTGSLPPSEQIAAPAVRPVARLWATRGVWLGLLAVLLGGAGQAALFLEATQGQGALLLTGAAVLAALAWSRTRPGQPLDRRTAGRSGLITWRRGLVLRLAGIGLAGVGTVGSIVAWQAQPEAIFGLQGVLWVASMAVLLIACARWYPRGAPDPAAGPPWTRGETALFVGLIALALGTYVIALDALPWRFHYDEVIAYTESLRFYGPPQISLFTTTWWNTGLPSLWFAVTGGLMQLTGPGLAGTRLGVALMGALTVIPTYGLVRLAWGRTAAALTAGAIALSATYIHYSRVSIPNVVTTFWWTACFYFLLRGLRSRRPGDFVAAGLLAGLSQYTYYGTRLLPYLLLAFASYLGVFHWRAARERLGHLALVGVGFGVGFGPLIAYFQQNPTMWAGRGLSTLNIPPGIPTTWDAVVQDWNILAPLAARNVLGLSVLASRDTVYYAPFFPAAAAMLVVLGLGVLVWRWRQPEAALVLLWGLGVVGVSTLLDASTIPNFAHWAPAFPALFIALALPLALWLAALRRAGRRAGRVGAALMLGGALIWGGQNAYDYLVTYPGRVPPDHSLFAAQGRLLEAAGPGTRVRFVGRSWQPYFAEVAALIAPNTPASDLLNPSRELPVPGDPARDLLFVFYNDNAGYLPVVQAYYPGGTVTEVTPPGTTPVATAYRVPKAVALARYGVQATFTGPDGQLLWTGRVPRVGTLPSGVPLSFPATARWSGALWLPIGAPFQARLDGLAPARLLIQGTETGPDTVVQADAGWVPFEVQARLSGPTPLYLLLAQGGPATEPPTLHLWPQSPEAGLAVRMDGGPVDRRVDPFIGAGVSGTSAMLYPAGLPVPMLAGDPEGRPLGSATGGGGLIRWSGEIYAEEGIYAMELRTDARARLTVGTVRVVDLCSPQAGAPGGTGLIKLSAGWHPVTLTYENAGGVGGLEWFWTRPDGQREIVPPARLRHTPGEWPDPPARVTCTP